MVRVTYRNEDIDDTYDYIKTTALGRASAVLVLTANEIDALAATKMITTLLKADNITFSMQIISSVTKLQESFAKHASKDEMVVIMINCGATFNIPKLFGLQQGGNARCFIMDNHRPFHLANIYSPYAVTVFDDLALYFDTAMLPEDGSGTSTALLRVSLDVIDALLLL